MTFVRLIIPAFLASLQCRPYCPSSAKNAMMDALVQIDSYYSIIKGVAKDQTMKKGISYPYRIFHAQGGAYRLRQTASKHEFKVLLSVEVTQFF